MTTLTTARADPWSDLCAGPAVDHGHDMHPWSSDLRIIGSVWPAWSKGEPPTWSEFIASPEVEPERRLWIVSRRLLRDTDRLVAWALDCSKALLTRRPVSATDVSNEVVAPLRRWLAGDRSMDIASLRRLCLRAYASDFIDRDIGDETPDVESIEAALCLALPHLAAMSEEP